MRMVLLPEALCYKSPFLGTGCLPLRLAVRLGGWASFTTVLRVKARDQVDLLNITLLIRGGRILDLPSSVSYYVSLGKITSF